MDRPVYRLISSFFFFFTRLQVIIRLNVCVSIAPVTWDYSRSKNEKPAFNV